MFLRANTRKKDGKVHRYWSVVESRRTADDRVLQRQVLYLGEINDTQKAAGTRAIEVFGDEGAARQVAIFPDDRPAPELACEVVQIRVSELSWHRPRQWGACWLALELWGQLDLDGFWPLRLPPSRQGTRWLYVLKTLVVYRLIDPGSEWRLHRHWYHHSALGDLLGEDESVAQDDTLYRCLDKLLAHKRPFFSYLRARWQDLFGVGFEVLLYDLTSTYFESDPPEDGKRKFGYSRDKRFDCVQVVIALIVTPEGFPPSPTKFWRGTPPTTAHCPIFWTGSKRSTAKPSASGSWIGAFQPRRCWRECALPKLRCVIWSAHQKGA